MGKPFRRNDVIIFVDGNPATGCSNYSLSSDLDLWGQNNLGDDNVGSYILNDTQTHKLGMTWWFGKNCPAQHFNIIDNPNEFFNSGNHVVAIRDTVEEQLVSGAYLTNFSINASVGDLASMSVSLDCDTVTHNTDTLVNPNFDSLTGAFPVVQPKNALVQNITIPPYFHYNSGCIQNLSLEIDIPRKPVTRIGSKVPVTRAVSGPATISLSVETIKDQVKNMDSNYRNESLREVGDLNFLVTDSFSGEYEIIVKNLTFAGCDEGLSLDGFETLTYNYRGQIGKDGFSVNSTNLAGLISFDGFTIESSDGYTLTT